MSFRPELIAARALVAGEGNLQKGHARRCKCGFDPGRDIAIELQPSNSTSLAISQQEIMLTPNTRSVPSSRRSRCRGWSIWSSNPPNPNVGIQQNHGGASHSSVATGSKGSWNSSTEPAKTSPRDGIGSDRLRDDQHPDSLAWFRRKSVQNEFACSPTVVSVQCASTASV